MGVEQPPRGRVRWTPMIIFTLIGAWLVWRTYVIAGDGNTKDVTVSFLVEASAAVVLLALFFLAERSFTREVTRTVVRQVHDEVVAPLEQRLTTLSRRIDDLQRDVDEKADEQRLWHHGLVSAMDVPTFDNVAAALTEASRLRAIGSGVVRAQANRDPRGIWLDFSYGADFADGHRVGDDVIRVTAYPAENPHSFSVMSQDWHPNEDVVAVAARVRDMLRQHGYYQPVNRPDWTMALRNVQRALDATLPDDARIAGPLHQLVGDLAITERGIEHVDGRLLIALADFPDLPTSRSLLSSQQEGVDWNPPCPDGIDELDWQVVTTQALHHVGGVRRLHFDSPSQKLWVPKGVGYNS